MTGDLEEISRLLTTCTSDERYTIFKRLRDEFSIHPIEGKLNTTAEVILEAINRASDLSLRGVRGLIAEAAFAIDIVPTLSGWRDITPPGNHSYDFLLTDGAGNVRVQVKMQRQKEHRPMTAKEGYRSLPADMYVVETQKTRGGEDSQGQNTRPYRFNEFDVLAVNMHPSTNDWRRFLYTVAGWLLPAKDNQGYLLKFQPVPKESSERWTDDFAKCVNWFRSGEKHSILDNL